MSIAAKKMAEVLAWPEQDRALLARQLIASLDNTVETDAETQWHEVIDRRSREMAEGRVDALPKQIEEKIKADLYEGLEFERFVVQFAQQPRAIGDLFRRLAKNILSSRRAKQAAERTRRPEAAQLELLQEAQSEA